MGEHGGLGSAGGTAGELEVADLMGHDLARGTAQLVCALPAGRPDEVIVRLVRAGVSPEDDDLGPVDLALELGQEAGIIDAADALRSEEDLAVCGLVVSTVEIGKGMCWAC